MAEKFLLKDLLFNQAKVEQIAGEIQRVYSSFNTNEFVREVVAKFPELELKARIAWIAECLRQFLPEDYEQAVRLMLRALPPPNNPDLSDGDFGDFIYAPYGEYVARYGCTEKHLQFSLAALHEITQRFSAEDANVIIDYILYFQNKAGKLNSKKVFKLAKLALAENQPVPVSKRHMLRERMTTRTLYPGKHEIEIQVNGKKLAKKTFVLK